MRGAMRSMTGFGTGEASLGEGRALVEVRSLNHRYLEVRTSMATELVGHGWILEQEARKRLDRGRYDIAARVVGLTPLAPQFDMARARLAYQSLCELRDELAPGTDVPIAALASLPELFSANPSIAGDLVADALRGALKNALVGLDEMRLREGDALRADLAGCLERMGQHRDTIESKTSNAVQRQRDKLHARVEQLLRDRGTAVDEARLENEIALLADRIDIAEELTRLESHFAQLADMLGTDEPVGRKMDFLLQEVAREINTISAKSQDAEVSQTAVELKAEIARMRQQIQNVA
jgi:uncharacterized protein (TIGR00255 family)